MSRHAGRPRRLVLASNNAAKAVELRALLAGCGWQVATPAELSLPPIDPIEGGRSYLENATIKATAFARVARMAALAEDLGVPAQRIKVIPNGVDTDRFRRDEAAGIEIRKQLGIGIDDPVVGIVAALRPEKNHELLFRAVEEVSHDMPSIRLLIVGDGPRRQELKQRVLDRSISEIVHFLGNRTDVPAVLSALDLFALSSHNEANPVSILEAMSIGLPVVAPRVGSISESVLEGTTGYLVSPGSLVELTDRIKEILSNQVLGRRMGEEGRRVVLKNWSLETMVAGYERLITDIYEAKRCGTLFRASKVNNDDDPSSTEGDKNSEKDDSELVAGVSGGF